MTFNPMGFVEQLPNMGMGMLGIFIVMGVIIAVTYGLNAMFPEKK